MSDLDPIHSRDGREDSTRKSSKENEFEATSLPTSGIKVSEEISSYIRNKDIPPQTAQMLLEKISEYIKLYSKEIESQHLRGEVVPLDKITSDKDLQILIQNNIQRSFPNSDYATTDFILQNAVKEFALSESNDLLSSVRKFHLCNALYRNQYQFSIMIADKEGLYICLDAEKMKKIQYCLDKYIKENSAERIAFSSLEDIRKQYINKDEPLKSKEENYFMNEIIGRIVTILDDILLKRQRKLEQKVEAKQAGKQKEEPITEKFTGRSEQERKEFLLIDCLNSILKRSNLNYFVDCYRSSNPNRGNEIDTEVVVSNYKAFLLQIKEYLSQYLSNDSKIIDIYKLFESTPRELWNIRRNPKFAEYMASESAKKAFVNNNYAWTDLHLQRAFRDYNGGKDQINLNKVTRFDFNIDNYNAQLDTIFQIFADGRDSYYKLASTDKDEIEKLKICLGCYTVSHLGKFSFLIGEK